MPILTSQPLSHIPCTFCQGAGLEVQTATRAVCKFCGTVNSLEGVLCAECASLNPAKADVCGECGRGLYRACVNCGTRNWNGHDHCEKCGQPLDTLSFMAPRSGQNTASRLDEQQRGSRSLKAQEASAADRRMAGMMEIEERRQQTLRAAGERSAANERLIMTVTIVAVVAFLVLVAVVFFLTASTP